MRKIISGIIILLIAVSAVAYNDSDITRDGFNLWATGHDINLRGRAIHNGTFDGTFVGGSGCTDCPNSTVAGNLENWNATGNSTYDTLFAQNNETNLQQNATDAQVKAYVNTTFEPNITASTASKFWGWDKTFKDILISYIIGLGSILDTHNSTTDVVNNNLVNWNTTSFNGSPVDMNGSSFYNGSQQAGTFNHSNLTRLNWTESKHNITSDIDFWNYNLNNVTRIRGPYYGHTSASQFIKMDRYRTATYNQTQMSFIFQSLSDQDDKAVFFTNAQGGNSGLAYAFNTGASDLIALDFNPANVLTWRFGMPDTPDFAVERKSGAGDFKVINANVNVSNMMGSGNDYVCVDPNGVLFRSNAAC